MQESTVLCGRYRLEQRIGRGGMAEVWAAHDDRLGRPVAVKVLRAEVAGRADVRDRLRREARAAARLDHPGIVRVLDTDEVDGQPFLVLERLPGETLADRLRAGVDDAWLIDAARRLGDALAAAHAAGVIHRDIKPGNVMLDADGAPRIGDFGIATSLEVGEDHTTTGLVLGTPAYLAPERIQGAPASVASDVFALGVVLYEAFTGQRPFDGVNPAAVAQAVLTETPVPLAELRPDLPRELTTAVDRAIEKEPGARLPSAAALATAARAAQQAVDQVADDDATTAVTVTDTQVMPAVVPASVAASPVAATMVAFATEAGEWASRAVVRVAEDVRTWWQGPTRSRRTVALGAAGAALVALFAVVGWLGAGGDAEPARAESPAVTAQSVPPPAPVSTEEEAGDDEPEDKGKSKGKGKDKHEDEGDDD